MISTRQAAKRLGISAMALSRYIAAKKIPAPKMEKIGRMPVHIWTEADIERVRQILPSIENGRKTRHQKQRQKKQRKKSK